MQEPRPHPAPPGPHSVHTGPAPCAYAPAPRSCEPAPRSYRPPPPRACRFTQPACRFTPPTRRRHRSARTGRSPFRCPAAVAPASGPRTVSTGPPPQPCAAHVRSGLRPTGSGLPLPRSPEHPHPQHLTPAIRPTPGARDPIYPRSELYLNTPPISDPRSPRPCSPGPCWSTPDSASSPCSSRPCSSSPCSSRPRSSGPRSSSPPRRDPAAATRCASQAGWRSTVTARCIQRDCSGAACIRRHSGISCSRLLRPPLPDCVPLR